MPSLVRDLIQFAVAHVRWTASFRRVWVALAVIATLGVAAALLPGKADDRIRYCGLALQLLGVGTVLVLLREKTETFGRSSFVGYIRERLAARPRFRPPNRTVTVSGISSSFATGSAHASVWRNPATAASPDERLAMLEGNIETLRKDLEWHAQQARQASESLRSELNTERQGRQEAVASVALKLDRFGAGGLHIEAIGLFWLFLGIIMATVPTELATLLGLAQ